MEVPDYERIRSELATLITRIDEYDHRYTAIAWVTHARQYTGEDMTEKQREILKSHFDHLKTTQNDIKTVRKDIQFAEDWLNSPFDTRTKQKIHADLLKYVSSLGDNVDIVLEGSTTVLDSVEHALDINL